MHSLIEPPQGADTHRSPFAHELRALRGKPLGWVGACAVWLRSYALASGAECMMYEQMEKSMRLGIKTSVSITYYRGLKVTDFGSSKSSLSILNKWGYWVDSMAHSRRPHSQYSEPAESGACLTACVSFGMGFSQWQPQKWGELERLSGTWNSHPKKMLWASSYLFVQSLEFLSS